MLQTQAQISTAYDIEESLIKDGIAQKDAKAFVRAMSKFQTGTIATKTDILRLENKIDTNVSELDHKIDTVHAELNTKIDTVHAELNAKIDTDIARVETKIDTVQKDVQQLRYNVKKDIEIASHNNNKYLLKWLAAIGSAILIISKIADKFL